MILVKNQINYTGNIKEFCSGNYVDKTLKYIIY